MWLVYEKDMKVLHTTFCLTATDVSNPGDIEKASSLMIGNSPCGCSKTCTNNKTQNHSDTSPPQCVRPGVNNGVLKTISQPNWLFRWPLHNTWVKRSNNGYSIDSVAGSVRCGKCTRRSDASTRTQIILYNPETFVWASASTHVSLTYLMTHYVPFLLTHVN